MILAPCWTSVFAFSSLQPHLYALHRNTKHGLSAILDRINEHGGTALYAS